MPEPKAQLVDPQGPIDVPGISATGIITATGGFVGAVQGAATGFAATTYNISAGVVTSTGFVGDVTGTASSVTKGANLSVGVMTASSFAGDVFGNAAGLSTTTAGLKLGIVSATSFAGNFTGIGSGITGTPHIQAGVMTATSFLGNFTGLASGLTGTPNLMVGILTGTAYSGDGSNLTGIAATNWITNNVTANSSTTTVNLSLGNIVKFVQSADTTVSFANTGTSNIVSFIRTKDSSATARSLTWPSTIKWNGGSAPTLITDSQSGDGDVNLITLLTRDEGVTWYGWETVKNESELKNELYAWGNQGTTNYGQHGLSNNLYISSPTQIPGTTWNTVSGAYYAGYGVKTDGTLWAWGNNEYGGLGQNNVNDTNSPVQIPGTTWSSPINSGKDWCGACVKTDGTLWTWGNNQYGQLGLNNKTLYSSPVQVPGTTWRSISGAYHNMIGTKTDGTLWTWGKFGARGHNNLTHISSPVQVPGTTWGSETKGDSSDTWFNMKTDGTIWCAGNNGNGQLAQNDTVPRSSPIQVPGTYETFSQGYYGGFGIKSNGTMWGWGDNGHGRLGLNTINDSRSSPTQIPGTTWSSVQGGWGVLATRTDGTLWSMGRNEGYVPAGQGGGLGLNDDNHRSSPTQIPGTTWYSPLPFKSARGGVFAFKKAY